MQTIEEKVTHSDALFEALYDAGNLREGRALCLEHLQRAFDSDEHVLWSARAAMLEQMAGNLYPALMILHAARPSTDRAQNHRNIGRYLSTLALTRTLLFEQEKDSKIADAALMDFESARWHYERVEAWGCIGGIENNIGLLQIAMGRPSEAHVALNKAREIYVHLFDPAHVAQVDDTRARAFLAEGLLDEALDAAHASTSMLRAVGGGHALQISLDTLAEVVEALKQKSQSAVR